MAQWCNIDVCKRQSCALCYCCNKNVCFNHLKEHWDLIQSQLNPLINEINLMTFDIEILFDQCPQKSDKWDDDQNKIIHHFCQQEHPTYGQYFIKRIDKLRKDISQLRYIITECIFEHDTTNEVIILLTLTIRHVKEEVETIKQKIILNDLPPLITDNFIFLGPPETNHFDLSTLSSPFQTIICTNPLGSALASNHRQLLMNQRLNLHVFDQDLTLIKQFQWKHGFIRSMCWSATLNSFILTTSNEEVLLISDSLTSTERIQVIQNQNWCSCTCSDTSLFLTTNGRGTNIFEFNLSSCFELVQQWKTPHSCQEHELIHDIVCNNQTLALIIEDSFSNMVHIELRLSVTLGLLWSLRPDIKCNLFQPAIRCCSLRYDEWLVIDSNSSRLLHITNDGQMRSSHMYKSPPWNATLCGSNTLAIRTENSLNFHKI